MQKMMTSSLAILTAAFLCGCSGPEAETAQASDPAAIMQEVERKVANIEQQVAEAERKAIAEAERAYQDAQDKRQAEEKQRAAERAAELAARRQATEETIRQAQEEAAAKKAVRETHKKQEQAQRQARQLAARDTKQKELTALAAEEFSKLNLEPQVMLSQTFQSVGASAQVKGKDRAKILTLYKNQQWLDLINLVLKTDFSGYAAIDHGTVRQAAEQLRKREFQVVITSSVTDFANNKELVMVVLKNEETNPVYVRRRRWSKHPDGTGLIHPWSANEGRPIFGVSDSAGQYDTEFYALMNDYRATKDGLDTKLDLGELDQAGYDQAVQAAIKTAHARGEKWALGL